MTSPASRNAQAAARQARYRDRMEILAKSVDELIGALSDSVDETGCSWLTDNLPEGRQAQIDALLERIQGARIIAVRGGADRCE